MGASGRTYVVPDLHGRFDLLKLALSSIEKNEAGSVVFTGDYIDRGPQSREVIERLIAGPSTGWKWICLLGNHEDMLIQASQNWLKIRQWLRNGGEATLRSYGSKTGSMLDFSMVEPAHVAWMQALPLFHRDQHRVYVHAGMEEGVPLDQQSKHTLIWKRYGEGSAEGYGALHIVVSDVLRPRL
ncbi:metallophosphoesterase [Methylocapsa sp. S129]|uniref:metallophosphoesterase n=1 Tax=Methylocapsa sp. S129 TaxID=1641869 RepID=UPI00131BE061|nr:metallophosphoesterase [Methylocapsa sp. S129]